MSLTIETGAIVAGADSYASVAELSSFATARGFTTLPALDADKEVLLRNACDFLDSLEGRYKGTRVSDSQPLAWPRKDVYLFSTATLFDKTTIPSQLKNAQCQLACDAVKFTLQPTGTGREVLKQKTDVIETEFAKVGVGTIRAEFNKAMAILAPTLRGGSFGVQTIRV